MIKQIRQFGKKNPLLRRVIGYHLASSGFFDSFFKNYKLSNYWERRINDVISCPDNEAISRCQNAGAIIGGKQYLHNGLKIHLGSYYGPEYARMLIQSKGVHEPQEEKVFGEVLKYIPDNATMIEMGAFWSYYSMWFNKCVKGARNFMIEPDAFNLGHGKRNFRLNKMKGHFTQAYVGQVSEPASEIPTLCIDDYVQKQKLDFVHILHSDIQGYEFEMLLGATKTFAANKIGYIFISTHSNELHYKCLAFLNEKSFSIIAEADIDNTFSEDGLIVAKAPFLNEPYEVEIAQKMKVKADTDVQITAFDN